MLTPRYLVPFHPRELPHFFTDVLIIGGGLAGLRAANAVDPRLSVLVVTNGFEGEVNFTMPPAAQGADWSLLIDTNILDVVPGQKFKFGDVYQVTGRSLLLFSLDVAKSAA